MSGTLLTRETLLRRADQVGSGLYGDGSDGDVTISGTVTLTRDMYYDTLIVPSGAILQPGGCRIYCRTKCDIQAGAIVRNNGGNAALSVGGGATTAVTLAASRAGPSISGGGAGAQPTLLSNSLGGNGGNSGAGSSGAGATGGVATAPTLANGALRHGSALAMGLFVGTGGLTQVGVGGGGASGGGDGTFNGGGGGGGGGPIHIVARVLIVNGTLECRGGNGGNGSASTTGGCGGGGGGGGGVFMALYDVLAGANSAFSAATNCPGGNGGTKTGTGVDGSPGGVGSVRTLANRPL